MACRRPLFVQVIFKTMNFYFSVVSIDIYIMLIFLYSINYHHSGANKTWYGVPGDAASRFEEVALDRVFCNTILLKHDDRVDGAFQALANKTTLFSPNVLLQHRVPVYRVVQQPGEYVITFPKSYHAGFSHGN